jgi:lysozyme family protein
VNSFDDAFTALIGNEGGYSNNPADPGGETMWGITARVARANGYTGAMRDLPLATAKTIAKSEYWDSLSLDQLDPHIAFQMFDANYNGGDTVRWAQQASGADIDGKMGPNTIAAIQATDPRIFVLRFLAYRLKYLNGLKSWPTFSRGWSNRIADNMLKGATA